MAGPYVAFFICVLLPLSFFVFCAAVRWFDANARRQQQLARSGGDPPPGGRIIIANGPAAETRKQFTIITIPKSAGKTKGIFDGSSAVAGARGRTGAAPVSSVADARLDELEEGNGEENDGENDEENDGEGEMCSICLGSWRGGERQCQLICQHLFHEGCIKQWLDAHTTCPVCKRDQDILAIDKMESAGKESLKALPPRPATPRPAAATAWPARGSAAAVAGEEAPATARVTLFPGPMYQMGGSV